MSWAGSGTPIQSNVPDYQKMLQSNLLSSGWSSRGGSERYNSYSHPKSPLSPTPQDTLTNGLSYSDSVHRPHYQSYRPSKYGITDSTYLEKDFKELSAEDTYSYPKYDSTVSKDTLERPRYDIKDTLERPHKYDSSSELYQRKYSSYTVSHGEDIDGPINDNNWASPPKSAPSDIPSSVYTAPVKSRSSVTDGADYVRDSRKSSTLYEDKYYSDNDAVTRSSKSRSRYGGDLKYMTGDLRQWQRGHMDTYRETSPSTQQTSLDSSYWTNTRGFTYSGNSKGETNGGFDSLFKNIDDNPRKWASVSKAADDIIKEKDTLVEKLKMQVMRLEEDNKQYEGKLKRAVLNGEGGEGEAYKQIQELELKNAQLKAENAEIRTKKNAELDELEMKLGATEQEVDQLRAILRKRGSGPEYSNSQFYELDREKEDWKRKYLEMFDNHSQMKEKLDELQSYLSDLPTVEESMKNVQELQSLREKIQFQEGRIEELQQRLYEGKKALTSREVQIQELEQKEKRLAGQVAVVTGEIDRIKSEGEGAELHKCEEQLQRVKHENERLAIDLDKAKKLLEMSHRKLRHSEVKHQNEVKQLQERLTHEEESVEALRGDCRMKEENIKKLKRSMKELSSKNQDLMEQILIIREQLKTLEEQVADENQKIQRQFTQELSMCYHELQSLVQVCVQRAEGNDPNMSLLLGVRAPSELETGQENKEQEAHTLKQWLGKVKELRAEIEGLRGLICNKYAEDLGDNMNCVTQ
ncbi:centrosomal protein of 85 kDa-like [Saccostrea echinata]|uniref:centrosomal protein of 85 kDa-like n=1 Tax=Saccostrea echinata TaxID=191078 RepID=UPI002A81E94B|nr:centrosomal protein of 85 kDa-like [Saccostrea echinata]